MAEITSEIGGYLDISANAPLNNKICYDYALNAARFCLEYILVERGYKSIWLPYYSCDSLTKAASRAGAKVHYYNIDNNFFPLIEGDIQDSPILFINYYGLMTKTCKIISQKYKTVIIDNAQAYYALPVEGVDCIYSPRKFFALPDGGLINPGTPLKIPTMDIDVSYDRMEHMVKRIDCGAENAYPISVSNRDIIAASNIKRMSKLTQLMLLQINTQYAANRRRENYEVLQSELSQFNALNIPMAYNDVPLFYPFIYKSDILRTKLNKAKIYTPTYWPGIEQLVDDTSFDMYLYKYMHPLVIDQRYSIEDMYRISKAVKDILSDEI